MKESQQIVLMHQDYLSKAFRKVKKSLSRVSKETWKGIFALD